MAYTKKEIAFLVSGLIPLLGLTSRPPSITLLLYTVFVLVYLLKKRSTFGAAGQQRVAWVLFKASFLSLFLTETLAWFDNYLIDFARPGALFHPNYFLDLLIGSGYYIGLAIAWYLLNRRYTFTLAQAFCTYGLLGVFLEQKGIVVVQAGSLLFTNPLWALMTVMYVFLVHGSIMGFIYLGLQDTVRGTVDSKRKYVAAILVMTIGVVVGTLSSGTIALLVSG